MTDMTGETYNRDSLKLVKGLVQNGNFKEAKRVVAQANLPAAKRNEWLSAISSKERKALNTQPTIVLKKQKSRKQAAVLAIVLLLIVGGVLLYQLFVPRVNINDTIAQQRQSERIYQNAIIDCRERYSSANDIRECVLDTLTSSGVENIHIFMDSYDAEHYR